LAYDCTIPAQTRKLSELRLAALDFIRATQNKTRRLRRELHDTLVELENLTKLAENLSPQKLTHAEAHDTHQTTDRLSETDPKLFEPAGSLGRKKRCPESHLTAP